MLEPEPDPEPGDYYYYPEHSLTVLENETGLSFVFDAKTVIHAEDAVRYLGRDLYNTCALYADANSALYFVSRNGYTKIADNVTDCVLSSSGDFAVYLCADTGARAALCRYDTEKKVSVKIERSAYFTKGAGLVLSADGASFTYSKNFRVGDRDSVYLSENGKQGVLLDGITAVDCLSTDAKNLLWHDGTEYFLRTRSGDTPLDTDLPSTIRANRDCTEFVYAKSTGGTWLLTANDLTRLSDAAVLGLYFPTGTLTGTGVTAMVNHFRVKLFSASETVSGARGLCYIDSRQTDTFYAHVAIPADDYVSYNLTILYYIEDGRLVKFNRQHPDETTVLADNAAAGSLLLSRDGKFLYYTDTAGQLCRVNGGETTALGTLSGTACLAQDGTMYYTDPDGSLYCARSSAAPVSIPLPAQGGQLVCADSEVFLLSGEGLYVLSGEAAPVLLCEGVLRVLPHA